MSEKDMGSAQSFAVRLPLPPATGDGGAAFPLPDERGMSLLDWFAGQALNGLYAGRPDGGIDSRDGDLDADALLAYRMAAAMLRARAALSLSHSAE